MPAPSHGPDAPLSRRGEKDPPLPAGEVAVHDPSTPVVCGGVTWVFGTGPGICSLYSADRIHWRQGPRVFDAAPDWTRDRVPLNRGHLWAPDLLHHRERYRLYYSVSSWGSRISAIGLVTSPTLDPASPACRWEDQGVVVATTEQDDHNAIDPSVMLDENGRMWMAYGSFWSGIKLVELDPDSGLRRSPGSPIHALAWKEQIEAACVFRRGGWYYLIVNWGHCCRGVDSTYQMRIGRSRCVTGPYLDRDGADLIDGGGTLFHQTSGPFIGPGHAGILIDGDAWWMSHHYYSGRHQGQSRLDILPLRWTDSDWPHCTARRADPWRKTIDAVHES